MTAPVLSARDIKLHFPVRTGGIIRGTFQNLRAVDRVSLHIARGETLGIVGESGCGKSSLGRAVTMMTPPTEGEVEWLGDDVVHITRKVRQRRRRNIQLVFQDPLSSLNPRLTIGEIIAEPLHSFFPDMQADEKHSRVQDMLDRVGLLPNMINRYPHEFSGGQCQRISIARAIITRPKLVFLDEPVSALDVSIQAQIINLLKDLQEEFELSYLFISHDLSIVRNFCDRVMVMYLGKVVEEGDVEQVFSAPKHPYTQALIASLPKIDPAATADNGEIPIKGELPSPLNPPSGCAFRTRCRHATEICAQAAPELVAVSREQLVACHHWEKLAQATGEPA